MRATAIRGVTSEGMICASEEIGLKEAFPPTDPFAVLDLGEALGSTDLKPGQSVGDVLGMTGDVVMDIEVTGNRPDAMGRIGLAREAAAILKKNFLWTPALPDPPLPQEKKSEGLCVEIRDPDLCPRYIGVRLEGVKVGPSPWWMKRRLLSAGVRPINNLVDITNYVLLELGQPMHVFDAQKLNGDTIVIRKAQNGEALCALDGKTCELQSSMLVVADASSDRRCQVMGGEDGRHGNDNLYSL